MAGNSREGRSVGQVGQGCWSPRRSPPQLSWSVHPRRHLLPFPFPSQHNFFISLPFLTPAPAGSTLLPSPIALPPSSAGKINLETHSPHIVVRLITLGFLITHLILRLPSKSRL